MPKMKKYLALLAASLLTACNSIMPIDYRPSPVDSLAAARETLEKLTLTEHHTWRPSYFSINDKYMEWGSGTVTTPNPNAFTIANVTYNANYTTKGVSDRLYFSDIAEIRLRLWVRKNREWYVAYVVTRRGAQVDLLRSLYREDAEQYIDALHAIWTASAN